MTEKDPQKEAELQQKYLELQAYNQRLQKHHKQLEELDQNTTELEKIKMDLHEISKVKPGSETLVPIANGIFAKATINDTENLIVNVGAGTTVTKTVDETIAMLIKQSEEILEFRKKVEAQLQKIMDKASKVEQELSNV